MMAVSSGNGLKGKRRRTRRPVGFLTRGAIRRLARRGGVKRMSHLIYDEIRQILKEYLTATIRGAVYLIRSSRRKTITARDIVKILQLRGITMYGF